MQQPASALPTKEKIEALLFLWGCRYENVDRLSVGAALSGQASFARAPGRAPNVDVRKAMALGR
jgi:hypothetical protein